MIDSYHAARARELLKQYCSAVKTDIRYQEYLRTVQTEKQWPWGPMPLSEKEQSAMGAEL